MIILFNNEMLSALLRTVWSVIRMTPERLLHEVILVDDASNITGEKECQTWQGCSFVPSPYVPQIATLNYAKAARHTHTCLFFLP